MAKLWKPVFSYERGRQILLFLFCLFLALIIWTLHKLSENQTVYLQYKLHVITNLSGREADAVSDEALVIKGEANGFYVLRNNYSKNIPVISLDINNKYVKKSYEGEDLFIIKSSDIYEKVSDFLANNVSNITISTDTLHFNFPRRSTRKVPVIPMINNSSNPSKIGLEVKVTPEFVTVTGTGVLTVKADSIYTNNIDYSGIPVQKSGVVKLQTKPGIKYSVNEVYYSVKPIIVK
jgi:hypothetical protein